MKELTATRNTISISDSGSKASACWIMGENVHSFNFLCFAGGRPANRLLSGADIALAKAWVARRPKNAYRRRGSASRATNARAANGARSFVVRPNSHPQPPPLFAEGDPWPPAPPAEVVPPEEVAPPDEVIPPDEASNATSAFTLVSARTPESAAGITPESTPPLPAPWWARYLP